MGIGNMLVFRESDVFRLFWEVILSSSQEELLSLSGNRVRILRKHVAMVLIKVLPNRI